MTKHKTKKSRLTAIYKCKGHINKALEDKENKKNEIRKIRNLVSQYRNLVRKAHTFNDEEKQFFNFQMRGLTPPSLDGIRF